MDNIKILEIGYDGGYDKNMEKTHPIILDILRNRGISEESDVLEFLSDKPSLTYDPFLLLNMEEGVDLILSTIEQKKKICIYGDYDADGVTSVCLMLQILSQLTSNVSYYIPSRFDEGYGLNMDALDTIQSQGTNLIITVDCGSVSFDEVEHAKKLGMDILVTDHHSLNDKPPQCLLINPKQVDCQYPFKHLAGCGVAFKLAQGIQRKANLPKSTLTAVLDLVAIATVGDIVPLVGENRTLVKHGLGVINRGTRQGLRELIKSVGLTLGQIKSENLAYVIVPHLNAAGRMLDAKIGVELLTSLAGDQISESVKLLISNNKERKMVQEETFQSCLSLMEKTLKDDLFLVIDAKEAHEGITGIVAGKIKEKVLKPTIIVTPLEGNNSSNEGYLKGTGRSLEGVNLYNLLKSHEELFDKFGGHAGACGFTMKAENLSLLRQFLNEDMKALMTSNPDLFTKEIKVDGELMEGDVNLAFAKQLEGLAPFGYENEKPTFEIRNIHLSKILYMGQDKQHMRMTCTGSQGKKFPCVLFQKAQEYASISEVTSYKIIGYPDINNWNGKSQVQILIEKISEDTKPC